MSAFDKDEADAGVDCLLVFCSAKAIVPTAVNNIVAANIFIKSTVSFWSARALPGARRYSSERVGKGES
ncbi:hypothetical protein [Ochrobactrum sp. EDr1-4]|uniref:hypothetical protein n=1 Tax=Ochrobactrum sp. EDr1-4 TaxID=3368622 RepID=UPI003B9E76F9